MFCKERFFVQKTAPQEVPSREIVFASGVHSLYIQDAVRTTRGVPHCDHSECFGQDSSVAVRRSRRSTSGAKIKEEEGPEALEFE